MTSDPGCGFGASIPTGTASRYATLCNYRVWTWFEIAGNSGLLQKTTPKAIYGHSDSWWDRRWSDFGLARPALELLRTHSLTVNTGSGIVDSSVAFLLLGCLIEVLSNELLDPLRFFLVHTVCGSISDIDHAGATHPVWADLDAISGAH